MSPLQQQSEFDVVVMAGNVPLFTPPGTQAALVAGCARHVKALLVAGFTVDDRYSLAEYDAHCEAAGLTFGPCAPSASPIMCAATTRARSASNWSTPAAIPTGSTRATRRWTSLTPTRRSQPLLLY